MNDQPRNQHWWRPYRLQVVILLLILLGPFLLGVAAAVVLPIIQSLR